MSSLLRRIAVFSARHRALVIGAWLLLLVGLVAGSHAAGTKYSSSAQVAGSDSKAANDVMARSFSKELSDASPVVYHTDTGTITDDAHRPVVEQSLRSLSREDDVASVTDPFADGTATVSKDGRTAYATVLPSSALGDMSVEQADAILDAAAEPAKGTDVQVEAGGQLGTKISKPETHTSELIGIAAAMLVLLLVFGTVTAMVLPIAAAIVGVLGGLSLISLLGHLVAVPDVAPTVAT